MGGNEDALSAHGASHALVPPNPGACRLCETRPLVPSWPAGPSPCQRVTSKNGKARVFSTRQPLPKSLWPLEPPIALASALRQRARFSLVGAGGTRGFSPPRALHSFPLQLALPFSADPLTSITPAVRPAAVQVSLKVPRYSHSFRTRHTSYQVKHI